MACVVKNCSEHTGSKNLMCSKHWYMLPVNVRADVRRGTEKGEHSLRARPTREWLAVASKSVGELRHLIVSVGADSKVRRKFSNQKPAEPAAA